MSKKKNKRRARRSKSNLIPLAAVALGVYLLMRDRQTVIGPVKPSPSTLPGKQPAQAVGTRPNRQRYINTYI